MNVINHLDAIVDEKGVVASYLYAKNGDVIANSDCSLKKDALQKIGVCYFDRALESKDNLIKSSLFTLTKHRIITTPVSSEKILVTICKEHADTSKIRVISDRMSFKINGSSSGETGNDGEVTQKKAALLETHNVDPLEKRLASIESSLSEILGPVAKLIYKEGIEQWKKEEDGGFETLHKLINMLAEEIDDPDLANAFRENALCCDC